MESYTIFYSWQSDYDYSKARLESQKNEKNQNETEIKPLSQRVLIQKLLESQAYGLGRKYKCNITVDQDTDDTPGMQPISDIVIKKIRNCQFFVCDVTPVISINRAEDEKWNKLMPNSNVMFELGVAMSYLQSGQIIAIAHETSGNWIISELPFDISHRKIIKFKSAADLEKDLSSALESSLRYYRSRKGKWKRFVSNITNLFIPSPLEESETQKEQAALYNSDVFFNNRMSRSFPGIRGLKQIDIDIHTLESFFKEPISNSDVSPMMIIDQSNRQHPIKHFKYLGNETLLIGNTEVFLPDILMRDFQGLSSHKCRPIFIVYRHPNRTFQFIYIICCSQNPVEYNNDLLIRNYGVLFENDGSNYEKHNVDIQEYVVFIDNKNNEVEFSITKELYQDLSIDNYDENHFVHRGRFEYRRRYLRDSELMIVPTNSVFDKNVYNDIIEILSYYDFHGNQDAINECEEQLNTYFQTIISSKEQKRKWR